jgi:hypothetical protein
VKKQAEYFKGLQAIHDPKFLWETDTFMLFTRKNGFREKNEPVWGALKYAPLLVWKDQRMRADWKSSLGFGHIVNTGDDPNFLFVCAGFPFTNGRRYVLLLVAVTPQGKKRLSSGVLQDYEQYPMRMFNLNDMLGPSLPPVLRSVSQLVGDLKPLQEQFQAAVMSLFKPGGRQGSLYYLQAEDVSSFHSI